MKNYYEILEIHPRASQEIIEKAYKVLVKKYHPDIYTGNEKSIIEEKIKEINESYKILSDPFLKQQYDRELENETTYNNIQKQQVSRKNIDTNPKNKQKKETNKKHKIGTFGAIVDICKDLINTRKGREKKKKKGMEKNDLVAILLTIICIIILGIILWFIPFTNTWMRQLLFENPIFNGIASIFSK